VIILKFHISRFLISSIIVVTVVIVIGHRGCWVGCATPVSWDAMGLSQYQCWKFSVGMLSTP